MRFGQHRRLISSFRLAPVHSGCGRRGYSNGDNDSDPRARSSGNSEGPKRDIRRPAQYAASQNHSVYTASTGDHQVTFSPERATARDQNGSYEEHRERCDHEGTAEGARVQQRGQSECSNRSICSPICPSGRERRSSLRPSALPRCHDGNDDDADEVRENPSPSEASVIDPTRISDITPTATPARASIVTLRRIGQVSPTNDVVLTLEGVVQIPMCPQREDQAGAIPGEEDHRRTGRHRRGCAEVDRAVDRRWRSGKQPTARRVPASPGRRRRAEASEIGRSPMCGRSACVRDDARTSIVPPITSSTLPRTKPTTEALTTSCSPAASAKLAMTSSGTFPNVTFRRPPMPGPEREARSSVARPSRAPVGITGQSGENYRRVSVGFSKPMAIGMNGPSR